MTDSDDPELNKTPEADAPPASDAEIKPAEKPRTTRGFWGWVGRVTMDAGISVIVLAGTLLVLYYWASSAAFEDYVRHRLIYQIEQATGGRVELGSFHWDLLHLRVEAGNITIHGIEPAGQAPYAHLDRLRLQVSILNLFTIDSPTHVILREAEILRPAFHLIVYPDGSTNQPQPKHPRKSTKPVMDSIFDAQIGQLDVEQGSAHIADVQVPFDMQARDAHIHLSWVPDSSASIGPVARMDSPHAPGMNPPGGYRVQVTLGELSFVQGKFEPVRSRVDASLMLFHDSVQLDSLRLAALNRTLNLSGTLTDFSHPAWKAQADGEVDLRIVTPLAGVDSVRGGVVTLKASGNGRGAEFQANGDIAGTGVHFQNHSVDARTATFSSHLHFDQKQALVSAFQAQLEQGGKVDGEFRYDNWLDDTPSPSAQRVLMRKHKSWPVPAGLVRANVNGVTLDTVLAMLAGPRYRHLGLGASFSGPATSTWSGIGYDLQIGGQIAIAPPAVDVPGEAPVRGSVDANYVNDSGSVKVRTMDIRLPRSSIEGKGSIGVFPISRASEVDLDIGSSDLSEFDAILRTLNLTDGNRTGSAALPVSLKGQAQFHGQLNSSWLNPRIEGRLVATHVGIEMPSSSADPNAPPRFSDWDSVDVEGLYTPASIVVRHSTLRRGSASLSISGHLDAHDPEYKLDDPEPEFDSNSVLSVTAAAQQFPVGDLLTLAGVNGPRDNQLSGKVDANLSIQGPVKALVGAGSVDVSNAKFYGEQVDHIHAGGSINNGAGNARGGELLKIDSLVVRQSSGPNGGRISGSGSYDFVQRNFKIDAVGSAIDLAGIQSLKQAGVGVTGKLAFTVDGDGSVSKDGQIDPRLQAKATFSAMTIADEPVADLMVTATTRQHLVNYDLSSHQPAGEFKAHGETTFDSGFTTQASLEFSKFDIGALLKLSHVTGINGQSDLEGTARISGPLAHPDKLSGEASLKDLAVVVQGVHLASKGAVHAVLTSGVVHLDPIEITGEDTDIKLLGTLAVTGKKQLDLVANGSINMRLAESLDPDLIASGVTNFTMEAHGPLLDPILQGKVEFQNASLALQDFPNGLSQIKGTLEFIQNRLEVRSLTAMSGGGQLSVSGYLGFQHGLYADLAATGRAIRIRYPEGISSIADANLHLLGPQNNLLLSGNVVVTRFAINSDLDVAAFASQAGGVPALVSPDAPSNHIHFDVHLTSAPQLNFQNAYAKLSGNVDLHLHGTLASPTLLGRISLTDGSTSIAGTKYELQRGDIYFNNPVRIQPNIDLDATARVEDYDITLGLHGTPDKLNVTYRSEPPLPEADVIALLALGHTSDEQSAYVQQQQQAGDNPMTDALLGGALNATVSNRVQRLFGSGAVKIDPNFIGSLGNSTARVTVVEQIGKSLTFTYASNVNTTTQQLIQAEIAINRHVSLLVTQDESGIFSVVVKNRRRFR